MACAGWCAQCRVSACSFRYSVTAVCLTVLALLRDVILHTCTHTNRELTRAVGDGGELLADALPGSLAQGSKLLRKLNADKQAAADDAAAGGYRGSGVCSSVHC
jgi:hypothetical protein